MKAMLFRLVAAAVVALCAGVATAQPSNDDCINAIQLTGTSIDFDNSAATFDGPASTCEGSGVGFGHTIWYRYIAPATTMVTVSTCNATFDTVLMVWAGNCSGLLLVACNDDACLGLKSSLSYSAVEGGSYLIEIAAYHTNLGGTGTLNVQDGVSSPPAPFTFQGELANGGAPVNGSADVRFTLFSTPSGTSGQVGSTLEATSILVQAGLLEIDLDFGARAFDGTDRFLEMAVRAPAGSGNYTTLIPRQQLTRTPHARYADEAASVAWSGITGMPAGFADGVDDTGPWIQNGSVVSYSVGHVGIGTTGPISDLHVMRGDAGAINPNANAIITAENSNSAYIDILAPDNRETGLLFGRPGSPQTAQAGAIVFNNGSLPDGLQLRTGGNATHLAITSDGKVGIGTLAPDQLLSIAGTGANASKPGGGSWASFSDARLKHDIRPLEGALDKLLRLRGVSFYYNDPGAISELPGERIGMVAQEVESVFPDWVETGARGYKTVTYRGFEALTVEALRDLRAEKDREIADLRARIERLEAALEKRPATEGPRAGAS
jgi:hypothetical protein